LPGEMLTVRVNGQPAGQQVPWTAFGDLVCLDLDTDSHQAPVRPTVFGLGLNYPNPFNPGTTLSYQLPEASLVRMSVWNVTGQRVRQLVRAQQPAGTYSVTWDGRDDAGRLLPNGSYRLDLVGVTELGEQVRVTRLVNYRR